MKIISAFPRTMIHPEKMGCLSQISIFREGIFSKIAQLSCQYFKTQSKADEVSNFHTKLMQFSEFKVVIFRPGFHKLMKFQFVFPSFALREDWNVSSRLWIQKFEGRFYWQQFGTSQMWKLWDDEAVKSKFALKRHQIMNMGCIMILYWIVLYL